MTPHPDDKDPRRIVIIIDNLGLGGAQKLLHVQISEMSKTHHLRIINLGPATDLAHSFAAQGVDVVSQGGMRLTDLRAMLKLRRELAEWRPDLIHSHLLYATVIGSVLARLLKVPHVATIHNEKAAATGFTDKVRGWLEQFALRQMTVVAIACGPKIAKIQSPRVGKTPLVTVSNKIRPAQHLSPEARHLLRKAAGIADSDIVVLAAGRLVPQKGFDVLLSAFAQAVKTTPQALLLIVGEGQERIALEQQAKSLQLADRVRFSGEVPDLGNMLQMADVFALSSRHEGLPLVLIEALSAALPIIATRVGDVETVLDDGCGIIVSADQVQPFASALEQVLASPDLREKMSKSAGVASQKHSDVASFIAELQAVYVKAKHFYDTGG
ncbi:glycosyltransferase [Pseudotabrizicola sp.]|uniref:glycosyltransferase n=1 Tax=Pseudotabrizicola sp. TaxID=2939647 RepID=UPI00271FEBF1|nr:glycosyltransferase [Pseudotabrizicola sp.]MDO8883848.1 glycosyltransferase [Pseudotabrizicola sp.]